jgi:lipopolysaccharide transport system permease protein
LWALLQPLTAMVLFTAVFSRGLGLKSAVAPYPLFVLAGWAAWGVFAQSLSRSSDSLVQNSSLVTKIYFPRMILPAAAAAAFLPDFLISLLMLVPVMIYYRVFPGAGLIALPGLMLMLMVFAASVGMFLAALNVRFRDVKFIISFLVQMWFFATPVVYPYGSVPAPYRELMMLNPMTGIIEGFRWSLLGGPLPGRELAVAGALTLAALVVAQVYFNRVERSFADVV